MQQHTYSTTGISISAAGRLAGAWRAFREMIDAVDGVLALWYFRATSRRDVDRLDDRLLRDIGLDPLEARRESDKPFWKK
ncbi:MAG: DUF1127 domain-containing protein [Arenicellales bacterium]